jgi:hypothetical protein
MTAVSDCDERAIVRRVMRSSSQGKLWWKSQEEIASIFERLFRPIEERVRVGVMRQLDVGVIDERAGENRIIALVEVQKRKARVGIEDLGTWIYKKQTLNAQELVAVSEQGFTRSAIKHVQQLRGLC